MPSNMTPDARKTVTVVDGARRAVVLTELCDLWVSRGLRVRSVGLASDIKQLVGGGTARITEVEQVAREDTELDRNARLPKVPQGRSVALVLADRTTAVQAEVALRYSMIGMARRTQFKGSGYRRG
jgi:hypothetical protein